MLVIFIKDYQHHEKGSKIEVNGAMGRYLIKSGVATEFKPTKK